MKHDVQTIAAAVDAAQFKAALGRFCSGVTVVTARTAEGVRGMTATAFSSLSLRPPQILLCIANSAKMSQALAQTQHFGVSILAEDQSDISAFFAGGGVRDKVPDTEPLGGAFVVHGAIAQLECRLASRHDEGDHTIYVGRVEACRVGDGAPLLYFSGTYGALQRA
ncbi:MAG TPA: flavin reductase family protein [Phenylobacterium sp.]|nr:flavin reductase family protein [Phenylobacterium sp.]